MLSLEIFATVAPFSDFYFPFRLLPFLFFPIFVYFSQFYAGEEGQSLLRPKGEGPIFRRGFWWGLKKHSEGDSKGAQSELHVSS